MEHNNNNMRTTWAQQYNKGVVIITIRGYTSSIEPNNLLLAFQNKIFDNISDFSLL